MAKTLTTAEKLLCQIEEYLRLANTTATTFGVQAVNDRNLVYDLRKGRRVTLDVYDRIRAFIEADMKRKRFRIVDGWRIDHRIPFPKDARPSR